MARRTGGIAATSATSPKIMATSPKIMAKRTGAGKSSPKREQVGGSSSSSFNPNQNQQWDENMLLANFEDDYKPTYNPNLAKKKAERERLLQQQQEKKQEEEEEEDKNRGKSRAKSTRAKSTRAKSTRAKSSRKSPVRQASKSKSRSPKRGGLTEALDEMFVDMDEL